MYLNLARSAFVIVAMVAVGATVFRVSTAPERIKERRNTARSVCVGSGGSWVQMGADEICQKDGQGGDPAKKI